jgi:hypothetical protein
MERHTKDAADLKALILRDLHKEPGCEEVSEIVIQRLETRENGANWTVKEFESAPKEVCRGVLQNIVRFLQLSYDIA